MRHAQDAEAEATGGKQPGATDAAGDAWATALRHAAGGDDATAPQPVVLIGTARSLEGVPVALRRTFHLILKLGAPPPAARLSALQHCLADLGGDQQARGALGEARGGAVGLGAGDVR